ncbi:protein translocase subunit SecF [Dietzia sp.]|uniref:protein translocase subunit SecF n=1 Tax=Dietzia sp. TaxID=1871616 RepID=UPI002FD88F41
MSTSATSVDTGSDGTANPADSAAVAKKESWLTRLYTGTGGFPIVQKRKIYYIIALLIFLVCMASIVFRGFTLGIDFEGGTKLAVPAPGVDPAVAAQVVGDATGEEVAQSQLVGSGSAQQVEIQMPFLDTQQITDAKNALFEQFHPVNAQGDESPNAIGDSNRSESWGSSVTKKAVIALIVFVAVVFVYIMIRFEWAMSLAAMVSMLYVLVFTAGIYSIVGWEVSPATVIGLLTILSFALYDTVVVFDKVQENTTGHRHRKRNTYAEEANLAVNQTLMRSINTTVISLLPLAALVVIAVVILGVGTLRDLALVQVVGIFTGTLSSIFLATPLLVDIKSRTPAIKKHNAEVAAFRKNRADRAAAAQ